MSVLRFENIKNSPLKKYSVRWLTVDGLNDQIEITSPKGIVYILIKYNLLNYNMIFNGTKKIYSVSNRRIIKFKEHRIKYFVHNLITNELTPFVLLKKTEKKLANEYINNGYEMILGGLGYAISYKQRQLLNQILESQSIDDILNINPF